MNIELVIQGIQDSKALSSTSIQRVYGEQLWKEGRQPTRLERREQTLGTRILYAGMGTTHNG